MLIDNDKEWDKVKESYQAQAFQYLESLQAVHERKVFECMEPILGLLRDTFTFYHQVTTLRSSYNIPCEYYIYSIL